MTMNANFNTGTSDESVLLSSLPLFAPFRYAGFKTLPIHVRMMDGIVMNVSSGSVYRPVGDCLVLRIDVDADIIKHVLSTSAFELRASIAWNAPVKQLSSR